jgi:hypothetical protein
MPTSNEIGPISGPPWFEHGRFLSEAIRRGPQGFAWAMSFFGLGFAARFALAPWLEPAPFLTFFPAVVAAGLFCGWRRGAVILVLSAVVAHYFFIDPTYSWAFRNTAAAMLVVSSGIPSFWEKSEKSMA